MNDRPEDLEPLLTALADGAPRLPESLAAHLGLRLETLAERVEAAQDFGLPLVAEMGGVSLRYPHGPLHSGVIAREGGLSPRSVQVLPWLDSTNGRLKTMAREGAPQGTALLAEAQWAGRGRLGRRWHSPFGENLYLSLLLRPPTLRPDLPALSLVAAMSVHGVLASFGVPKIMVKWPNDLWADGMKLAGILLESGQDRGGRPFLVLGMGVNVHMQTMPETGRTSLALAAPQVAWDRSLLAGRLLRELMVDHDRFMDQGFPGFAERWRQVDGLAGCPVRVMDGDGGFDGMAAGVDTGGRLLVQHGDELRAFRVGEVSVRPAKEDSGSW